MPQPVIKQIFISKKNGGELLELEKVEAVQYCGLRDDRYFKQFSVAPGNQNAITLIDVEKVNACNDTLQAKFSPADFRRNIITEGVDLNSLVGREFYIGEVKLRGYELCQPCRYISELLSADLLHAMDQRGGLRAEILAGGTLKVGDRIIVE